MIYIIFNLSGLFTVLELDLDEVAEKKLKELKLQNIPPIMPLDKPSLKEIDQNLLEISWLAATLPPTARQTLIRYFISKKLLQSAGGSLEDENFLLDFMSHCFNICCLTFKIL